MRSCITFIVLFGWLTSFASMRSDSVKRGVVTANGVSIAYEMIGSENQETILMVHGMSSQLTDWPEDFFRKLAAKGYRVIRYDHRDTGLSAKMDHLGRPDWGAVFPLVGTCQKPTLPYTLNDMVMDAVGLLDALQVRQTHLVGCSMGGAIAQLLAIQYPQRVLSLTSMMASSGNPARPQPDPELMKLFAEPIPDTNDTSILADAMTRIATALEGTEYRTTESELRKQMLNHVRRSWHPAGRERHVAAVLIGDNCDRREQLAKLRIPVLIIHGRSDRLVKVECGEEVSAVVPGAKLVTIEGMGHHIPSPLIDQIVAAIAEVVQRS